VAATPPFLDRRGDPAHTSRGGTIDKYIGDCIMALFGVPHALEDGASRAVDAALEMRTRLHAWRDAKGVQDAFDIHIGVNSGEAISGRVGAEAKQDYTVMGDAVNVASRLKDAAPRGRIFVGPVTWRHTQDGFDYREQDALALKGKEKPVKTYEVVGRRRPAVPSPDGAPSGRVSSDLVGRQKELDRLELHVLKAINGEGSIVFLRGEAGVGKSRLLAELRTKDSMRLEERLGARLELARTWAEVGTRLLEGRSRAAGLDGVSAREYLAKAEAFFAEKGLAWDLARLRESPAGSR
jgi:hypothetical protein